MKEPPKLFSDCPWCGESYTKGNIGDSHNCTSQMSVSPKLHDERDSEDETDTDP
jgi:hypothetical protein